MSLEKLRKKIDAIDARIISLLDERAKAAKEIGKLKRKGRLPVIELAREQEVIRKVSSLAKVMPGKSIERVYSQILSASRALQRPLRVSFLGPLGTFSHIAAKERFGDDALMLPQDCIDDVFLSVENGNADYAAVAVENSTEGSIASTLDLLLTTNLRIIGEKNLKVEHNLLAKKGMKLGDIRHVYGHAQALAQCKKFLDKLGAERHEVGSTAKACGMLGKGSAAVASSLSAELYHLSILKQRIQDRADNTTCFLILGRERPAPGGKDKTSIIFSVQDRPGALQEALSIFSKRKINLSKIESRPSRQRQWEYMFYADLEGHRDDAKVKEALRELENGAKFLKILGSYPRG